MITDTDLWEIIKKKRIPVNDIFMKDDPPNRIKHGGYIINLQDTRDAEGNRNSGTHWVALWFPNSPRKDIIYFDSFSFPIPQSLINWIRIKGGIYKNSRIVSNDIQIQDVDTGYCGSYALFFIEFMNKNKKINSIEALQKFVNLWSNNTKDNLNLLRQFVDYVVSSK